ncbi:MAG TPA: FliM/FliN family flagellar motor C-terminal domain-containing protein [Caulobacteraceae bacterium]|nr:FliM/FliN family flagellar motor C-terminal domain-containing protein [Caulobacteraceae bacterium]
MTAQPWLPVDALVREAVRAPLDAAVRRWSARWFAGRSVGVPRLAAVPATERPRGDWRVYRRAAAIDCSRQARTRIADLGLDCSLDRLTLGEADRRLVDAFEREVLRDLSQTVEDALGVLGDWRPAPETPAEPLGRLGGATAGLADDRGAPLLTLALPQACLLPLCRESLGPPRPGEEPPGSRVRALASTPVALEAVLGQAEVALADLKALAPGDVLVLDTRLDGPALLRVAGAGRPVAEGVLTQDEDALALKLK